MSDYTRFPTPPRNFSNRTPVDKVIRTIKQLVHSGRLQPDDRLPSETIFQKEHGINRHHLRQALQILEIYGIVRIVPQSGSYLTHIGPKALESLIDNVLSLDEPDFASLSDTRAVLEIRAARLAATYSNQEQRNELGTLLSDLHAEIHEGRRGLEEDYALHLRIALLSESNMLMSLISMIVPLCFEFSQSVDPESGNYRRSFREHEAIVKAIQAGDPDEAAAAMRVHMQQTYQATVDLLGLTPKLNLIENSL